MKHILRTLGWSVVTVIVVLAVGALGGFAVVGALTVLNWVSS